MPTIIVDKAKGLYQKAGTSANPAGSLSGQKDVIKTVDGDTTLTLADSGKIFVVGGAAGTIQFPVEKGWKGTFITTGSSGVNGNVIISGSAVTPSTGVSVDSRIFCIDGTANHIVGATTNIKFAAGGTESAEIQIHVASDTLILAKGLTTT